MRGIDVTQAGMMPVLAKNSASRFGMLENPVGATVFLSSEASCYVTDQLLYIDDGSMASI